jgi:hypothetical protein
MSTEKGREVTESLIHYGVKGMRWGVRRNRTPTSVTVTQKGKRLKAKGGANQPASSDAIKVRSLGQVSKKSGIQALSNKDLEEFNRRLNLEANAKRLAYQNKPPAGRFIAKFLGKQGSKTLDKAADEYASQKIKKLMARGAVTAAAAAI